MRPATLLHGRAPKRRGHGYVDGPFRVTVFGGELGRPHIHTLYGDDGERLLASFTYQRPHGRRDVELIDT